MAHSVDCICTAIPQFKYIYLYSKPFKDSPDTMLDSLVRQKSEVTTKFKTGFSHFKKSSWLSILWQWNSILEGKKGGWYLIYSFFIIILIYSLLISIRLKHILQNIENFHLNKPECHSWFALPSIIPSVIVIPFMISNNSYS